jgi:Ca-activated chloride channel family protein
MNKALTLAVAAILTTLLGLAACTSRDVTSGADNDNSSPRTASHSAQPPLPGRTQTRVREKKKVESEERFAPGKLSGIQDRLTKLQEMNSPALPRASISKAEVIALHGASTVQRRGRPSGLAGPSLNISRMPTEPVDRENYHHYNDNPVKLVAEQPVSTFSIDVDTGSYANVRRMLTTGHLPVQDAVRVEELLNYFDYHYPEPDDARQPFVVTTELGPAPWNGHAHLLHIGIKGIDMERHKLPPANLVFLVDISGSMRAPNKLALLKNALRLLTRQLRAQDRITLVVYAGGTGVILQPTPGDHKAVIMNALDQLSAGGRTNGAAGIRLAYAMAQQGFIPGGINRVLLATDGDFNVGTISFEALKDLVEEKRRSGVSLTTLGFGAGNYNDRLMEQLADAGNGNYAYIDTLNEARKVLVEQMSATLNTIAKDVKIQIEFNPAVVAEYRLVGYENRALRREDFNNDAVDAGEIGAGHTVTALYEITLTGEQGRRMDPLRYARPANTESSLDNELALLRLRYKLPDSDTSRLIETPLYRNSIQPTLAATSARYRFAASVAAFGQILRGGRYLGNFGWTDVRQLAQGSRGQDPFGYRGEFINLVGLAQSLSTGSGKPAPAVRPETIGSRIR